MDQLGIALLIIGFALRFLIRFFYLPWLSILAVVFLLLAVLRMLSRKIERRRTENELFLNLWRPFLSWSCERKQRWQDRKLYRYFRCPKGNQTVRVPKRKGKIRISCPQCGKRS